MNEERRAFQAEEIAEIVAGKLEISMLHGKGLLGFWSD